LRCSNEPTTLVYIISKQSGSIAPVARTHQADSDLLKGDRCIIVSIIHGNGCERAHHASLGTQQ
jgi:hypothetical protein